MGIADLRTAFNQSAPPGFSCQLAMLEYRRGAGGEVQVLKFSGSGPTDMFVVESDPVPPNGDLTAAARSTAAKLGIAPP